MTTTTLRIRFRQLVAALPHVLIHAALGMLIAALLGWLEAASKPVNEFNGLFWVIAVSFTGPIACALAAPFHVVCHARADEGWLRHLYSIAISATAYAVVWTALYLPFALGNRS